uniref:AlNc14C6G883 protein n=1 Tax=Albugo laibachii Nc14 TaxID=890382 RepID=F0W1B4_9STRA|nr:AlNc14C6G883 [Albugo laibachii Nc14]|eukprot:CCA14841.1 AlNc14C6G883 [Albugo laibachii Nc14]
MEDYSEKHKVSFKILSNHLDSFLYEWVTPKLTQHPLHYLLERNAQVVAHRLRERIFLLLNVRSEVLARYILNHPSNGLSIVFQIEQHNPCYQHLIRLGQLVQSMPLTPQNDS